MKRKLTVALMVALALAAATTLAHGDFYVIPVARGTGTPIESLPYRITAPGLYYLTKNLTSADQGIIVNADNVTIDLMGFTLTGPGTQSWSGVKPGVNTEVRNGTITNFNQGIWSDALAKNGTIAINLRVTKCGGGINVYQGLVKDCVVSDNQGGTGILNFKGVVTGNTVFGNQTGLNVGRCTVTRNTVTSNLQHGIMTTHSVFDDNTVIDNNTSGGSYQNIYQFSLTNIFGTNLAP